MRSQKLADGGIVKSQIGDEGWFNGSLIQWWNRKTGEEKMGDGSVVHWNGVLVKLWIGEMGTGEFADRENSGMAKTFNLALDWSGLIDDNAIISIDWHVGTRARAVDDKIDFISYSINPQEHSFDNLSLVENLHGQGEPGISFPLPHHNSRLK